MQQNAPNFTGIDAVIQRDQQRRVSELQQVGVKPTDDKFMEELQAQREATVEAERNRIMEATKAALVEKFQLDPESDEAEDFASLRAEQWSKGLPMVKYLDWKAKQRNPVVDFVDGVVQDMYLGSQEIFASATGGLMNLSSELGMNPYSVVAQQGSQYMDAVQKGYKGLARTGFRHGAETLLSPVAGMSGQYSTYDESYIDSLVGKDPSAPVRYSELFGQGAAGSVGSLIGEAVPSTIQSIPSMLAKDPRVRFILMAPYFVQAYGDAAEERMNIWRQQVELAEMAGVEPPPAPSMNEVRAAGAISGVAEVASEYVGDTLQRTMLALAGVKYFKGLKPNRVVRMMKGVGESLDRTVGPFGIVKQAIALGGMIATEIGEELLPMSVQEYITDPMAGKPTDWDAEDVAHTAKVSAVSTALLGGGAKALGTAAQSVENKEIRRQKAGEMMMSALEQKSEQMGVASVTREEPAAKADVKRDPMAAAARQALTRPSNLARSSVMVNEQIEQVAAGLRGAVMVHERDAQNVLSKDVRERMRIEGFNAKPTANIDGVMVFTRADQHSDALDAISKSNYSWLVGMPDLMTTSVPAGAIVVRAKDGQVIEVHPFSDKAQAEKHAPSIAHYAMQRDATVEMVETSRLGEVADSIQRSSDMDATMQGLAPQEQRPMPKRDVKRGVSVLRGAISADAVGGNVASHKKNKNQPFRSAYLTPKEIGDAKNGDVRVEVRMSPVSDKNLSADEKKLKTRTGIMPTIVDGSVTFSIKQKDGSVRKIVKPIRMDGAYVEQASPDGLFLIRENGSAISPRSAVVLGLHEAGTHRTMRRSRSGAAYVQKLLAMDPILAARAGASYMRARYPKLNGMSDLDIIAMYRGMYDSAMQVLSDPNATPKQRESAQSQLSQVQTFAEEGVANIPNEVVGTTMSMAVDFEGTYRNSQQRSLRSFASWLASVMVDSGLVGKQNKQFLYEIRQRLKGIAETELKFHKDLSKEVGRKYRELQGGARVLEQTAAAESTQAPQIDATSPMGQVVAPAAAKPAPQPAAQPSVPMKATTPAGQPLPPESMFSIRGAQAAVGGGETPTEDEARESIAAIAEATKNPDIASEIISKAAPALFKFLNLASQAQAQVAPIGSRPSSQRASTRPIPEDIAERAGVEEELPDIPVDVTMSPTGDDEAVARRILARPQGVGESLEASLMSDFDVEFSVRAARKPIARGEKAIINRLNQEYSRRDMPLEDVQFAQELVSRVGRSAGTALSILGPKNISRMVGNTSGMQTMGAYSFANDMISVATEAIKGGSFRKTFGHEFWHSITPYLTDEQIENMSDDYDRTRERFIDRTGLDPADLMNKTRGTNGVSPADQFITEADKQGLDPNEWYRLINEDEWIVENLADSTIDRMELEQSTKDIFGMGRLLLRNTMTSIRQVFGGAKYDAVARDFLAGRAPAEEYERVPARLRVQFARAQRRTDRGLKREQLRAEAQASAMSPMEAQFSLRPITQEEMTPAMKVWSRGSKVVDENGSLIPVYHGTSKDTNFTKFKIGKRGAWFTIDPEEASQYAMQNDSMDLKSEPTLADPFATRMTNTASRVIPAVLNLKNPAKYYKDVSTEDQKLLETSENYARAQGQVFDRLRRQGFDGIDFGNGTYVAFEPNQIKGYFNANPTADPRIMASFRRDDVQSTTRNAQETQNEPARDGGGRGEVRSLAPLAGAPVVSGATGPDANLVAVAERYARSIGIELRRQSEYARVDPERARRIAAAFTEMQHAPNDPAVRAAYEDMIRQTTAQYQALVDAGYRFWFFGDTNDPYEAKPWRAMRDLRQNKQMGVYSTAAGFGTAQFDNSQNPLLSETGIEWPDGSLDGPMRPVLANDLFRAVHDAFGHGLEGAGFRSDGEENAWQAHVRLFTGPAVAAMTSETRGQNSWLNYGPYGEQNKNASTLETVFADNKVGLMPSWTWEEGRVGDAEPQFSVRRKIDTSKLSESDAKWVNYEPTKTSTGRYMGAPEWVQNRRDLNKMRDTLEQLAEEGLAGRYWYEKSAQAVMRFVGFDFVKAEKFIQLLAIYSPNSNVWVNTLQAIRGYTHWAMGRPASSYDVGSALADGKAIDVLYNNKPWDGRKTNSFYINLMYDIVTRNPQALGVLNIDSEMIDAMRATIDVWMARAFGYVNEQFSDDKGSGKYSFSENETRRLTARLNAKRNEGDPLWTPHQVQAAIWTAMKTRYEDAGVKSRTNARGFAANIIKRGVDDKGRNIIVYPQSGDQRRQHLANWRSEAMKLKSPEVKKAASELARDFGDDIHRLVQNVTWETIPSPDVVTNIVGAPDDVKREFTSDSRRILIQDDGFDSLADKIGIAMYQSGLSVGTYDKAVSPNVITRLVPMRPKAYEGFNQDEALAYAAAIKFIFKQNAVPIIRLENAPLVSQAAKAELMFTVKSRRTEDGNVKESTKRFNTLDDARDYAASQSAKGIDASVLGGRYSFGIVIRTEKKVSPEQAQEILFEFGKVYADGNFTRIDDNTMLFMNFRDSNGVPMSMTDERFDGLLLQFYEDNKSKFGFTEIGNVRAEANYGTEHDWAADPTGERILNEGPLAERPDLHGWLRDRRAEAENLVSKYDANYIAQRARDLASGESAGSVIPDTSQFSVRRGAAGIKDAAVLRVIDRFDELRRYGEIAAQNVFRGALPDTHNPFLGARILSGTMVAQQQQAERDYADILRDQTENGISMEEMDQFLTAQHAINNGNSYIASINPRFQDGGTGMMNAEASRIIADAVARRRYGQMNRIAERWRGMLREGLRMRRDNGLITQEMYNTLTSRYSHYVPLRGAPARPFDELFEEGNTATGRGLSSQGRGMPQRLGRESMAENITSQVAFVHEDTLRRVARNKVGQQFLRLVVALDDQTMAEVIRPTIPMRVNGTVQQVFNSDWMSEPRNFGVYADAQITINGHTYERGDIIVIQINNPRLQAALTQPSMELRTFEKALQVAGNGFRFVTTGPANPVFAAVNMVRDVLTGAASNLAQHGIVDTAQMLSRWPRAWLNIMRDSWFNRAATDSYRDFIDAGGSMMMWKQNDLEAKAVDFDRLARSVERRDPNDRSTLKTVLGWYGAFFTAAETATRLAAFEQRLATGASEAQAALYARDITVDFAKGGLKKPVFNALYMFWNAGIQGTTNVFRGYRRNKALALGIFGLGFVTAAMARVMGGEDEETGNANWDNIPDYEKTSMLPIFDPRGSGKYAKIPLPYGYNALYSLGVRMADATLGPKTASDVAYGAVIDHLNAFNPMGGSGITGGAGGVLTSLTPTFLKPVVEIGLNENFSGRPIQPTKFTGDTSPQAYRYFDGTPDWAINASQWINETLGGDEWENATGAFEEFVSPNALQYLVGYYLSGFGRNLDRLYTIATGTEPVTVNQVPLVRSFVGDASTDTRAQSEQFYELKNKVAPALRRAEAMASPETTPEQMVRLQTTPIPEADVAVGIEIKRVENELRKIRKALKTAAPEEREALVEYRRQLMKFPIRMRNDLTRTNP
jgi:hypothetical protein